MVALRTSVLVLTSALVLAGCDGGDETMRATLKDDACTYDGRTAAHAGRFDIEVANETRFFAGFFLASSDSDTPVVDLQAQIDDILRRLGKPGESPARARFRTIVGSSVEPSGTSIIPADVKAGRYVVLCFVSQPTDPRQNSTDAVPPKAIYVAAQLDVTGTPTYR